MSRTAAVRIHPLRKAERPAFDWNYEQSESEKLALRKHFEARKDFEAALLPQWRAANAGKYEPEFEEHAAFGSYADCHLLQNKGWAAASTRPLWQRAFESWLIGDFQNGPLGRLETASSITLRFLLGGGTFTVRFETVISRDKGWIDLNEDGSDRCVSFENKLDLTVNTDGHLYRGNLITNHYDMVTRIVKLGSASQSVAERVARALDIIDADLQIAEHYSAYMPPATRCCACQRPLQDEISKAIGLGPDCAEKLGVPHTLELANRIPELRRQYLRQLSAET